MGVMNFNEEVEKMLYYAGSRKTVRMPIEGRSTRLLDRASLYSGRADLLTLLGCSCFDSSSVWGCFIIIYL